MSKYKVYDIQERRDHRITFDTRAEAIEWAFDFYGTTAIDRLALVQEALKPSLFPTMDDWTPEMSRAASLEGWDLFESHGSIYGSPRVQSFDDEDSADYPMSGSDSGPWRMYGGGRAFEIVRNGHEDHHVIARAILAFENPNELHAIMTGEPCMPHYVEVED
jgi:hypothetical protein